MNFFPGANQRRLFGPLPTDPASSPTPSLSVISTGAPSCFPFFRCPVRSHCQVGRHRLVYPGVWCQQPSRAAGAVCAKKVVYTRPRGALRARTGWAARHMWGRALPRMIVFFSFHLFRRGISPPPLLTHYLTLDHLITCGLSCSWGWLLCCCFVFNFAHSTFIHMHACRIIICYGALVTHTMVQHVGWYRPCVVA